MKNLICVIALVAVSVVSSFAQRCVEFEKMSFLVPSDLVVQSSCSTFAGSNGNVTITIENENYAKSIDSVEQKLVNIAKSQGYQVVENSTQDVNVVGAKGYYIDAKNEKSSAYYVGMILDEDKSQVLMKVVYRDECRDQAKFVINNIEIQTGAY